MKCMKDISLFNGSNATLMPLIAVILVLNLYRSIVSRVIDVRHLELGNRWRYVRL